MKKTSPQTFNGILSLIQFDHALGLLCLFHKDLFECRHNLLHSRYIFVQNRDVYMTLQTNNFCVTSLPEGSSLLPPLPPAPRAILP